MAKDINKENDNEEIIIAPEGANYLSDIPNFKFPVNCLFNKGKTGCGGTKFVLTNDENAIIAVPYKSLIKNKTKNTQEQEKIILGVDGNVKKERIHNYLQKNPIKKIMVTYDSLPRLIETIQEFDGEENKDKVFEDYFLLVDEWHCLFNAYDYRAKAIRTLLNVSPRFKRVTYMTATPILKKFTPRELKSLPVKRVDWKGEKRLRVHLYKEIKNYCAALLYTLSEIDKERPDVNFHIFLNSVHMIVDILAYRMIPPENVRIICADKKWNKVKINTLNDTTDETEEKEEQQEIIDKIQQTYTIGDISEDVKKYNFYTSAAFEGCDIFDPNGVNIIISNPFSAYTLLDFRTTVRQVCGRLRNSQYKDELYYIYMTKKQDNDYVYEKSVNKSIEKYNTDLDYYRKLNELGKEYTTQLYGSIDKTTIPPYIYFEDGKFRNEPIRLLLDIYKEYTQKVVFTSEENLIQECKLNNFEIVEKRCFKSEDTSEERIKELAERKKKYSWEKMFEMYHQLRTEMTNCFLPMSADIGIERIEALKPGIKEIYNRLGIEKIRELNYKKERLDSEMKKNTPQELTKLIDLFSEKIEYGNRIYTNKEINMIIQEICDEYNLHKITANKMIINFNYKNEEKKKDGQKVRFINRL